MRRRTLLSRGKSIGRRDRYASSRPTILLPGCRASFQLAPLSLRQPRWLSYLNADLYHYTRMAGLLVLRAKFRRKDAQKTQTVESFAPFGGQYIVGQGWR